jgi:MFS family permease
MFIYGITLSGSASSAYILGHCKAGKMSSAFTTLGAAYAVGYIFSPATAGFLSSAIDVRAPFIFTAIFYSLAALTLTRIASQRPVKTENPQTKIIVSAEKANFWKLGPVVALFAAMMFVLTLISALVPQFLRDVNHYDQGSILNLGSVYYLGAFVLSLVVGKIGDKYGKTSAVSFSMLLFAGALAVFVTFGGFDFQLVSAFLRGVSFSMWAYIGVLAGSIAPVTQQAKWISVVQTAARVASVPAAFVGGLLYEMSYQTPFIVCIVVALVLSVLVSFRFHRSKQKSSAEVVE